MPRRRPTECPECGHERLARAALRLRMEEGKLRPGGIRWTCQLCQYQWMETPALATDGWEPV